MHEKLGQDPKIKDSCAKMEETNMSNDSHIEKTLCAQSMDNHINDSSDHHEAQCPSPSKFVHDQETNEVADKSFCDKTCNKMSVFEDSKDPEISAGEKSNASDKHFSTETETQKASLHTKQSETVCMSLNQSVHETLKSVTLVHVPLQKAEQKPTESPGQSVDKALDLSESISEISPVDMITDEKDPSSSRGRPRKEKRIIKCEYCGRPFNHASAYVIHRRVHTGEKPFSCQDCGRAFAQLSNLRSHAKIHNTHKMISMQQPSRNTVSRTVAQDQMSTTLNIRIDCRTKSSAPFRRSRKPVACPICGKVFPYKSVLKIHLRIHSGERPYSCKVCGKAFTQACTVRVHERVHWSVKPFLCSKCGKGFSQIGTLKAHTCQGKRHTHATLKEMELAGVVTFRCHLCKKCFSSRKDYDHHLHAHTDNQRYSCDSCGQKYSLRSELEAHTKYCFSIWLAKTKSFSRHSSVKIHNKNIQSAKAARSLQPASAVFTSIKSPRFSSSDCSPKEYQSKLSKVQQSDISRPPDRKKYPSLLTCPPKVMATSTFDPQNNNNYCQPFKVSYFVTQLNSLDQKSDPRTYLCPRCGRIFRHVGRLRAHMLTHTRGKSFTCGKCGKISKNWSQFWHHQRVHKQRRGRFFCPKCGQGFRFVSVYMEHLQQHPELNSYFCPLCPHTFSNAKSLRTHQQEWHHSSMPHICDICNKGFVNPVILKRHRAAHGSKTTQKDTHYIVDIQPVVKPYECGKCDASFKTLDSLFNHQLCHSPPRDFIFSNGSNQRHEELKEQLLPLHKNNLHFSASFAQTNHSRPDISQGSLSTPSITSMDSDQSQAPRNIDPQNTTTSPALSLDSESTCLDEKKKPLCTYVSVKAKEVLSGVTEESKPEQKAGHLECAECGAGFSLLPALHQHYLEHARGEI